MPSLERLLLDSDITIEAVPYLEAVGFRVTLAIDCPLDIQDDTAVLKYARMHRFILVCNDKHARVSTPKSWYPELATRGGKVIEVAGGHLADPFPVVGKLLNYRAQWLAFFAQTNGAILLHDSGITEKPPYKLLAYVNRAMSLGITPSKALNEISPTPKRRRRAKTPSEQISLPSSGDA